MSEPTAQENRTYRRAEIMDADYVPQDEAPNIPRVAEPEAGGSVTAAVLLLACFFLLAMSLAASRGDGAPSSREDLSAREARIELVMGEPDREDDTNAERALGAEVETLSGPVAAYYSLKDSPLTPGVQVWEMESDGPAAEAGLQSGDVITAVDGEAILTAEELSRAIDLRPEGGERVFTVFRQGESLTLTIRLPGQPERNAGG